MNIDPSRFGKLRFEGASLRCIARKARKRSHTVRAWMYGRKK